MQVALDRFDLFHAHMFLTRGAPGRAPELGLLFHAKEYPRQCPAFPVDLGFCQLNSTLAVDQRAMDLRNLLFFRVRLVCPARSARPASRPGYVGRARLKCLPEHTHLMHAARRCRDSCAP